MSEKIDGAYKCYEDADSVTLVSGAIREGRYTGDYKGQSARMHEGIRTSPLVRVQKQLEEAMMWIHIGG